MTEARPLPDPPTDGVSALSYLPPHPNPSLLASTSWDGCVRIHDTSDMAHRATHAMESGPLLSLATPEIGGLGSAIFAGGLNGSVRAYDIPTATSTTIGRHAGSSDVNHLGCSCLATLDGLLPGGGATNRDCVVASAGWDSKFHLWDTRMSNGGGPGPAAAAAAAATVDLPGKAYSLDSNSDHAVVVATSNRRNVVIDVRMASSAAEGTNDDAEADGTTSPRATVSQDRESSLKYQTRCVRFFPDGTGMALGSIEGRVAIEYLDEGGGGGDEKPKRKKYAFKCHRVGDTVYPVNAIAFHPRFGTFATGGCDGAVVVWDGANKKRLTALAPKFATSVAALAFNHDGTELAVASSYTYEEGEREHPRDEVYVRRMLDEECRPKSKK